MSELYGSRGLVGVLSDTAGGADISARYEEYFAAWAGRENSAVSRVGLTTGMLGVATTPEQVGRQHAEACCRMAPYCESKGVARLRLLFEGLNEPHLWANEPPELVTRYYRAFLLGLHTFGLHGVVGNFGVGWPGNGGVQDAPVEWGFFSPVIDVMWASDYLGLHEYWALSGPQQNWRWWGGRFLQCPYKVPILITECGIDNGGDRRLVWRLV